MRFMMKGFRTRAAWTAAMGVALSAAPASAAPLYQSVSSFDQAGMGEFAFNVLVGSTGGPGQNQRELYNAFSLTVGSTITAVQIDDAGIFGGYGGPGEIQFYAASGGKPTGALLFGGLLGTPTGSTAIPNPFVNSTLYTFDITDFNLAAGDYVIGFLPADRKAFGPVAQWTKAAQTGFLADGFDGASASGSFVTGRGTAFAILGNATVTSAVPEPASWALMIGGFGFVGGTLRRQATKARLAVA